MCPRGEAEPDPMLDLLGQAHVQQPGQLTLQAAQATDVRLHLKFGYVTNHVLV